MGLSFLVVLFNALVVDLLTLPLFRKKPGGSIWVRLSPRIRARLVIVGSSVVATLGYGIYRVSSAEFRPGPRVAMLQTNEIIRFDSDLNRSQEDCLAQLEALVGKALAEAPRPDLIVWPETSYPYGYPEIEPSLETSLLDALVKEIHPDYIAADWTLKRDRVVGYFDYLMRATKVPMILGSSIYEFKKSGYSKFNSAILLQPGLARQVYRKMHLVPFGEYVPFLKTLPWLIRLTPYRGTRLHFLDHGPKPAWFELGKYRLAPAICFEDTVPHLVRRFFAEAPDGRQPDLLVNLSNDGWFKDTSEHEMHLAVSVFRCRGESRSRSPARPIPGVSAIVDGNGRDPQESLSEACKTRSSPTSTTPLDDSE